jgi:hypothetical protein
MALCVGDRQAAVFGGRSTPSKLLAVFAGSSGKTQQAGPDSRQWINQPHRKHYFPECAVGKSEERRLVEADGTLLARGSTKRPIPRFQGRSVLSIFPRNKILP